MGSGLDKELVGSTAIAVGTDVVDVVRIRRISIKANGFIERIFTTNEACYCLGSNSEVGQTAAERFAVRFAAKEAVLKALGVGLGAAKFTDIEVIRMPTGEPQIKLSGNAAKLASDRQIKGWLVSLSHSKDIAQAFVVALG